ncbi:hypothetical protein [Sphaerisporangium sp. TRM90804]|uniref:hypothetical protein n=1 Tax=Sphaerisporangium sp. TRM90804 TaxID=3031113 RepID=UPI00244D0CAD|nr:hypothetical protein [Sphaerisporangium sp. TRM90804]MDH2428652.1 hypothetical protein [Sphaerisporangium sp. TRM90804]
MTASGPPPDHDPGSAAEPGPQPPMPDFDVPDFDPRRTRRAVRAGVARTALVTLLALLALVLVATAGSAWVQKRGDRDDRMRNVLGAALQVANPGYHVQAGEVEAAPLSLSLRTDVRPLRAVGGFSAGPAFADRSDVVTQDFFGRVGATPLGQGTDTPLTYALYDVGTGNQPKDAMRQVLARLPADMNALAVVEFARPMTGDQLASFARRYGGCPETVVYESRPRSTPITWRLGAQAGPPGRPGGGRCADSPPETLRNLREWVGMLREHDEPNLRRFGLDLARLRGAAGAGRAYAYVEPGSRISTLRELIEDPLVTTVRVADVAFDLSRHE